MAKESTKVLRGLSHQTVITLVYAVIQLAYFSIMSRLLGKEDFGYYAVVMAISFVLMEISNAGLGAAVIQNKNASQEFINTAFTLSFFIAGFFSVLLFSISNILSSLLVGSSFLLFPLFVMAGALFFSTIGSVSTAMYMKDLQFLRFGIYKIISSLLSSVIGVSLAYFDYGVYSLVFAIFFNFFLLAVLTYTGKWNKFQFGINKDDIKRILTYGGWLTASGVIRSLYEQMDRLITTRWVSVSLLGTYTRASGFVIHVSDNVNSIFDTILFPILSGIQDDKEKLKSSYLKSTDLIFLMSIIFSFSMILLAKPIICIFLGEDWLDTILIFQIVAISLIFHPFCRLGDSFCRSLGIVKQYFYIRFSVCVISILLICIGCMLWGITGLAIAYVLARITDMLIKMIILRKFIDVSILTIIRNPFRNFVKIGILFVLAYLQLLYIEFDINWLIGIVFFIFNIILLIIFQPKAFGITFYDNIYMKIQKILTNKLKV